MSLTKLLPLLQELPRVDKLRVIQFLAVELAKEEGINLLEANGQYPIWTPLHAFAAADTLLEALHEEETADNG